jgi:transcriptional regulator with XRE-family HTH domain
VRHAADRAGLAHTTWSRIERGLVSADNRFTLGDIARALDCSVADLTGAPLAPADPALAAAQACVVPVRQALIETDLDEEPTTGTARPLPELVREADLIRDLFYRYDYAGMGAWLPGLLRELHAAAVTGPDREAALRLLVEVTHDAGFAVRYLGHGADQWLAAERCWQAAEALGQPVPLATAAFARSHAAIGGGAYARGLRLAEPAADALRPYLAAADALPMLGMLLLTCAYAARALHRDDDSHAWTSHAAEVAERTGETPVMHFGPTNVRIWRVSMDADGGDPGRAAEIAAATRPAAIPAVSRRTDFHVDTARALARLRGQDGAAVRQLLAAERIGPQHVRSSAIVRETARALLERARRDAGGSQLRGLCERVGVPL